jgi:hypothetical protein
MEPIYFMASPRKNKPESTLSAQLESFAIIARQIRIANSARVPPQPDAGRTARG